MSQKQVEVVYIILLITEAENEHMLLLKITHFCEFTLNFISKMKIPLHIISQPKQALQSKQNPGNYFNVPRKA